jgi:hypothetical protein
MSEIGIVPGVPGAGGYVELGASPQGRLFSKHILTINKQFLHPKTGRPITLGKQAWQQMKANFDSKRIIQAVSFPLANDRNEHTENPLAVAGTCVGLEREGDRVIATLDVRDPDVAERIADGRLRPPAPCCTWTRRTRRRVRGPAWHLLHVCGTLRPALVDLAPYEPVLAACGPAWATLPDGSELPPTPLMLCQSEVDAPVMLAEADPEPDYQRERDYRDYGGAAGMDEDYLKDEAARLGLMAMQAGSGRGDRPQYAGIVTDRDRQAALSAGELEDTDENVLKVMSGLAEQHQVSFSAVSCMAHDAHIRSGLGHSVPERAAVLAQVVIALSRGQLEVDDDQVLALSANGGSDTWVTDAEIVRLTTDQENEDIFGLVHPQKAGRKVTTKSRAHAPAGEDATDEDVDAKIARYLAMAEDAWGAQARRAVSHGNASYAPKSAAQRQREERRALAGGRPQSSR